MIDFCDCIDIPTSPEYDERLQRYLALREADRAQRAIENAQRLREDLELLFPTPQPFNQSDL